MEGVLEEETWMGYPCFIPFSSSVVTCIQHLVVTIDYQHSTAFLSSNSYRDPDRQTMSGMYVRIHPSSLPQLVPSEGCILRSNPLVVLLSWTSHTQG